jgi:hypothetical protein
MAWRMVNELSFLGKPNFCQCKESVHRLNCPPPKLIVLVVAYEDTVVVRGLHCL